MHRSMHLKEYIKRGGRLSFERAVFVLTPVIRQIASMHEQGLSHLNITPERIFINEAGQGVLLPALSRSKKTLAAGYAAPELYQSGGRVGFWTDVYTLSAILFFMVTGEQPANVKLRKKQNRSDALVLLEIEIRFLYGTAIDQGWMMNEAQRPQNAFELMKLLHIDELPPVNYDQINRYADRQSIESVETDSTDSTYNSASDLRNLFSKPSTQGTAVANKKIAFRYFSAKRKVILIITGLLAIAVFPAAKVLHQYNVEWHYSHAVSYVEGEQYLKAQEALAIVPDEYNDAEKLGLFIDAALNMQSKDFDKAKEGFYKLGSFHNAQLMIEEVDYQQTKEWLSRGEYAKSREGFIRLGTYKDSAQMLIEVDYQEALGCLNNGQYWEAEAAFNVLVKKKYKDSSDQLNEVLYRWAFECLEKEWYNMAVSRMERAKGYKDSEIQFEKMNAAIYKKGIELYRNEKYYEASECFKAIKSYQKSDVYSLLISAHKDLNASFKEAREKFNKIKALGKFEDAQKLLISDEFIYCKLEGEWSDGKGNTIKLQYREKKNEIFLEYSIPTFNVGKHHKIENGSCFFGDDEKGWKHVYDFTFKDDETLDVFSVKNGRHYLLKKKSSPKQVEQA